MVCTGNLGLHHVPDHVPPYLGSLYFGCVAWLICFEVVHDELIALQITGGIEHLGRHIDHTRCKPYSR